MPVDSYTDRVLVVIVRRLWQQARANGMTLVDMLKDHPELRVVGIAEAYAFAAANRDRYAEFFAKDGSLVGPGYTIDEAAALPQRLRIPGVVIKAAVPA